MPKDSYRKSLFVGRAKCLDQIVNWAGEKNPGEKRVLSVVGPPGCGKSWVLRRAGDMLDGSGYIVFWLDLSLDSQTGASKDDITGDPGLRAWLRAMVDLARQKCGDGVRADVGLDFADATLRALAEDVCEKCRPPRPVIIIVDGLEEVPAETQNRVQHRIIDRFWWYDCFRFLLAKRDQDALILELKEKEHLLPLDPLIKDERLEQLRKRIEHIGRYQKLRSREDEFIGRLLESLDPYQWQHPYLNSLLLEIAVPRYPAGDNPLFLRTDLRACLIEIAKPVSFTSAHFDLLRTMTGSYEQRGVKEFSIAHLRQWGCLNDEGYPTLKVLESLGMVVPAGKPRQAQRLADDILGLMRAWLRLS